MLVTVAIALLSAVSVSADVCVGDPAFPRCTEGDQPENDGNFRIPLPPIVPEWVNWFNQHINPDYPIPNIPPAVNNTPWAVSDPKYNKQGLTYGDPKNLGTELCACVKDKWGLTYDDGPSKLTPEFLQLLKDNNATATFFSIGGNIVVSSDSTANLKAAYSAGHQIALHTYTHHFLTTLSTEQIVSEIVLSAAATYKTIGKVPRYFRPPYGDIDDRVRNILVAFGLRPVVWTVLANDTSFPQQSPGSTWTAANATILFNNAISSGFESDLTFVPVSPASVPSGSSSFFPPEGTRYPGLISLEHELEQDMYDFAKAILPSIQKKYQTVTVATCDGDANKAYFDDADPFVQFIKTLPLVGTPSSSSSGPGPASTGSSGPVNSGSVSASSAKPSSTGTLSLNPKSDAVAAEVSYGVMAVATVFGFMISSFVA